MYILFRRMNPKKMPKRSSRASPTIGGTGLLSEAETVYIYGVMLLLWNFLTAAMVGFVLFWMVNWLPCTPVAAQREALTVQVICNFLQFFLQTF